jgi:two-component system chemotaxis response regulator CheY
VAKRVIFVDDSKTILASVELAVEELIKDNLIEFTSYIDPLELIEDIKSEKITYDLLFTDINMPQMNGFELSHKLKSIIHIKQKPIIALTTESTTEMKIKGKNAGVAGWIVKPFNDKKIISAIQKVLGI